MREIGAEKKRARGERTTKVCVCVYVCAYERGLYSIIEKEFSDTADRRNQTLSTLTQALLKWLISEIKINYLREHDGSLRET